MKNLTRVSLAAIALTAILGVTACGASISPAVPGESNDKPAAAAGVKDKGFKTPAVTPGLTLPADWEGEGGWNVPAIKGLELSEQIVAAGDVIGYVTDDNTIANGDSNYPPTKLVVFDGEGNQVYESKAKELYSESGSILKRVTKEGKSYLVYLYGGTLASSETSAKKTKSTSMSVTVVDGEGKEVFSKLLGGKERISIGTDKSTGEAMTNRVDDDSILITTTEVEGADKPISEQGKILSEKIQVMDVATGAVSDAPSMPNAKWAGRYNGVDLFRNAEGITNGTWTVKGGHLEKVGNLVQAVTFTKTTDGYPDDDICAVFDPRTGKTNPAFGLATGECIEVRATSTNGNYVINVNKSVLDISGGKVYRVGDDLDFQIRSVANDGTIYGKSGNGYVGHFNMGTEKEPVVEPGKNAIPYVLSDSGLAAFIDDASATYLVTKK